MPDNILGIVNNYKLQPKVANLFTLELDYVPGSTPSDAIYKMQLDLISAKRPSFSVQTISMSRINMKYKVAAAPSMDDTCEITFRDTIQNNLSKIFWRWYRMIFDPITGAMGYAQAYKTDGLIKVFDPLGNVLERWIFKGLFPSTVNMGDLSYENATNPLTVGVTFTYDVAFLDEVSRLGAIPTAARVASDNNQTWTADGPRPSNYDKDASDKTVVVIGNPDSIEK